MCYRDKCIPAKHAILSCFGCQRCCFRPTDEDLIQEFALHASKNDVASLNRLAGRVRMLKGEHYKIGQLCSRITHEPVPKDNPRRVSALHQASKHDHLEILLVMLKLEGCNPNEKESPCFYTPLHFAAKEGYAAMTTVLIKYKVSIDALDWKKNTACILAASNGHVLCVKALIDHGAQLNLRNVNGFNALIGAIINGRTQCALLCIKLGSDLDCFDKHHNTPLHLAIMRGDAQVVKFLLQCGAKVFAFNKFQASTLDDAKRSKSMEILSMVERGWIQHREKVRELRDAEEEE